VDLFALEQGRGT